MNNSLLIVGGGGFIGGYVACKGLDEGFDVWVTVRSSTSRKYLTDDRLHILEVDYDDRQQLEKVLTENVPESGRWDYVIYNLGATKAFDFPEFNKVNFQYLRTFCTVMRENGFIPELFIFMSSLSALGPYDETGYTEADEHLFPNPNTRYGLSKVKAEQWLELQSGMPWVIFRATGVYGPHEKDYLMMIKSIDRHFDFGIGFKKQLLTFIYVKDLVNAMYLAIKHKDNVVHKKYIIAEGRSYTQKEFRRIVADKLGGRWVIPVRLPLSVTWLACFISEKWGRMRLKTTTLNRDKFKILRQRNWAADVSAAQRDFEFSATYNLEKGIEETVEWYKSAGE